VDLDHPDLAGNLLTGYDATDGSDGAVNGDCFGNYAHGTCSSGIIAAIDNAIGIKGIAPNCRILSVRISQNDNISYDDEATEGMNYAWETAGADIISCSWGGGSSSESLNDEISYALDLGRDDLGCVVIFSAGNENGAVSYPASSNPDIIAVGAMSPCGERKNPSSCDGEDEWGSNYGAQLDLVAPGVLIPTTDIQGNGGYNPNFALHILAGGNKITSDYSNRDYTVWFNGTSAATPHVAGVAALILSVNPGLTQDQVRDIIESTCTKAGSYNYSTVAGRNNGTWNQQTGYGCLNAYAAVQAIYPYITGASLVCSSGAVFTLNNLPAVDSIRWIAGPYMSINTGQGTSACTFSATGGGSSWVQARLYTSCDSIIVPQKAVWAGLPSQPTDIFGFGHDGMEFGSESTYRFTANHSTNQSVDQYNWVVGGGTIEDGQGTRQITVLTDQAGDQPLYFDVSVRVGNACGWSPYLWRSGYVVEGDGQNDFVIYPNPATAEVMISVSDDRAASGAKDNNDDVFIKAVRILDSNGTLRRIESYGGGARSVTIDISDLQKGIYLIKINEGEGEETHRFIKR
jgi:hypothetical protein